MPCTEDGMVGFVGEADSYRLSPHVLHKVFLCITKTNQSWQVVCATQQTDLLITEMRIK